MIRPSRRDVMIGASAFLAVAIPILVLWPDALPETHTPVEHLTRLVSPATLALVLDGGLDRFECCLTALRLHIFGDEFVNRQSGRRALCVKGRRNQCGQQQKKKT